MAFTPELAVAITKKSVAGVIIALCNSVAEDEYFTSDQIIEFLGKQGLPNDKKKTKAQIASAATNEKISRGPVADSFGPKGADHSAARAALKAASNKPASTRAKKEAAPVQTVDGGDTESVLFDLSQEFGDPVEIVVGETFGPTYTLDGSATAATLINRAEAATGTRPTSYAMTNIGDTQAVLFPQ